MDETTRNKWVVRVIRELRFMSQINWDEQDVDFCMETLVHDILRSIHNAIVYVHGVNKITDSLDSWENRKNGN